MAKTIFEEMGGTYVRQGDYLLPCLSLLAKKKTSLLAYGDIDTCAISNSTAKYFIPICLQAAS